MLIRVLKFDVKSALVYKFRKVGSNTDFSVTDQDAVCRYKTKGICHKQTICMVVNHFSF